jgi:hypothetical protein
LYSGSRLLEQNWIWFNKGIKHRSKNVHCYCLLDDSAIYQPFVAIAESRNLSTKRGDIKEMKLASGCRKQATPNKAEPAVAPVLSAKIES